MPNESLDIPTLGYYVSEARTCYSSDKSPKSIIDNNQAETSTVLVESASGH
jgi:hypothetical protein